ncbi:MAG TPA: hypothetical protein VFR19_19460, partial [Hyphomicrobiaceae bacterium]|nr:hypothetical protein [Hyphomicrobiaceae bacterium]
MEEWQVCRRQRQLQRWASHDALLLAQDVTYGLGGQGRNSLLPRQELYDLRAGHGLRANGTYCLRAKCTCCLRAKGTYWLRAKGTTPWLAPSPRHKATAITDAAATVN